MIAAGTLVACVVVTPAPLAAGFALIIAGCVSLVINPPITQRLGYS